MRIYPEAGGKCEIHQHTLDYAFLALNRCGLKVYIPTTASVDEAGAAINPGSSTQINGMDCEVEFVKDMLLERNEIKWNIIPNGGFDENSRYVNIIFQ